MRKNIERAVARAENSGGSLICYVGAAHALFTPRVHQGGGARYMRQEYPGQVASILVEKVSETRHMTSLVRVYGDFGRTAMEEAALACMGHRDRVFVHLRGLSNSSCSTPCRRRTSIRLAASSPTRRAPGYRSVWRRSPRLHLQLERYPEQPRNPRCHPRRCGGARPVNGPVKPQFSSIPKRPVSAEC